MYACVDSSRTVLEHHKHAYLVFHDQCHKKVHTYNVNHVPVENWIRMYMYAMYCYGGDMIKFVKFQYYGVATELLHPFPL